MCIYPQVLAFLSPWLLCEFLSVIYFTKYFSGLPHSPVCSKNVTLVGCSLWQLIHPSSLSPRTPLFCMYGHLYLLTYDEAVNAEP